MSEPVWPVELAGAHSGAQVRLRGLRPRADKAEWLQLRRDSQEWTSTWTSTSPTPTTPVSFARMVKDQDREARVGRLLPFVLEVDGALAGQLHLFGITRGSLQSAAAGYWIAPSYAGRGLMPFALALAMDHAFGVLGLHRVEVNIRPDNEASLRVVAKLGMRDEGVRRAYLHIAGRWHDHRSFALTREDLGTESLVARLNRLSQQSL